jgi:hypothetical protein
VASAKEAPSKPSVRLSWTFPNSLVCRASAGSEGPVRRHCVWFRVVQGFCRSCLEYRDRKCLPLTADPGGCPWLDTEKDERGDPSRQPDGRRGHGILIQQPRTICIAIVPVTHDHPNQPISTNVWDMAPASERALGIITKPDRLEPNSGNAAMFLSPARNQEVFFQLG